MVEEIKEEIIQSPEVLPVKKKKPWLMIVLIVLLVISMGTVSVLAYQNYLLKNQIQTKEDSLKVNPKQTPINETQELLPTTTASTSGETLLEARNGWVKFTHPDVGYTIEYPSNWKGGLEQIKERIKQDYQDFYIESPDYQMSSEGYPFLKKGASFFIRAEKTQYSSIDEIFSNETLAQRIAFDKVITSVDGLRAIQYDYSYEGSRATMATFTKNKIYYIIKYSYVNDEEKQTLWSDYIKLLSSFKTN